MRPCIRPLVSSLVLWKQLPGQSSSFFAISAVFADRIDLVCVCHLHFARGAFSAFAPAVAQAGACWDIGKVATSESVNGLPTHDESSQWTLSVGIEIMGDVQTLLGSVYVELAVRSDFVGYGDLAV